jgi:D-alanine-D-alanine ligase
MNVWVILGGMSNEKEIALDSGLAVVKALMAGGHNTWAYDLASGETLPDFTPPEWSCSGLDDTNNSATATKNTTNNWAEQLLQTGRRFQDQIDVAFLALHGGAGEGGLVQSLLAAIDIPYSGSGPTASALCMDKALTKYLMESIAIPTPAWALVTPDTQVSMIESTAIVQLPVVVKPIIGGSSVGISIVSTPEEWAPALKLAAAATDPGDVGENGLHLLVEKFIPGREVTVGIIAGEPLPIVEIIPKDGFYDYERKYTAGQSTYEVPAKIDVDTAELLQVRARKLYNAAGCAGMARVDYRLSPENVGYCLELNTIPGLTATSLLPKAALAAGIEFTELLERICRAATSAPVAGRSPASPDPV